MRAAIPYEYLSKYDDGRRATKGNYARQSFYGWYAHLRRGLRLFGRVVNVCPLHPSKRANVARLCLIRREIFDPKNLTKENQ